MREPRVHTGPRQRSIDQIDRTTGEVLSEGALVWMPSRTQHPYGERWVAMTLDGLKKLMATPGIGLQEMKVFAELFSRLDYENFIQLAQIDIASATGMAKPNVSRSMKKLVEVGAIIPGPKVGRSQTYRLSPDIGWRGGKKQLRAALSVIEGGKQTTEPQPLRKTPEQIEREKLEAEGQQRLF